MVDVLQHSELRDRQGHAYTGGGGGAGGGQPTRGGGGGGGGQPTRGGGGQPILTISSE